MPEADVIPREPLIANQDPKNYWPNHEGHCIMQQERLYCNQVVVISRNHGTDRSDVAMADPKFPDQQGEPKEPLQPELARIFAEVYRLLRLYYYRNLEDQGEESGPIKNNGRPRRQRTP